MRLDRRNVLRGIASGWQDRYRGLACPDLGLLPFANGARAFGNEPAPDRRRMRPAGASPRDQTMKQAIDPSPSRRQVLRLAAMATACVLAAKTPNAEEALKRETNDSYVPADGV